MVKVISQETFDAAVQENIEEFGLDVAQARKDAIEQFKEIETNILEADEYELSREIDFIDDVQVSTTSNFKATSETNTLMREIHYPKYHFINDDDTYFKNEGYCVRDYIVGKYSTKIIFD